MLSKSRTFGSGKSVMPTITKDARRFIFSFKPKSLTADIQTTCNLTRKPGNIYK